MTRSAPRPVPALIAALGAALALAPACSPPPPDDLPTLRQRARDAHAATLAGRGDVEVTAETVVGLAPTSTTRYTSKATLHGDARRLDAWLDQEGSSWGWVLLADDRGTRVWPLDKFGWEQLTPSSPLQVPSLDRWFDLALMEHASMAGDGTHAGRPCHRLQLPVQTLEGQRAYLLDGLDDLAAIVRAAEAAGLTILRVEQIADGQEFVYTREGLGPALDHLRLTSQQLPGRLWAVEGEAFLEYAEPHTVAASPGQAAPAAAGLVTFDVLSELCVDHETLQPVLVRGVLRDYRHHQRRDAELRWSDHREVGGGETVAHQLDLVVGGEVFATARITGWTPIGAVDPALFDPAEVGRSLDLKMQADNEQSVRDYIAAGTHDGTETEDPDDEASRQRDEVFRPAELLERLGVGAGDVVADVGAGTGYFTFRLARAVGPNGSVYAVDVNPHAVAFIEQRGADRSLNPHDNVRGVVNRFDDAALPDRSVDLLFICWTVLHRFHHLSDTNRALLRSFHRAVRPGGRVAVLGEHPDSSRLPALPLGPAVIEPGRKGTAIDTLPAVGELLERHGRDVASPALGSDGLTTSARCLRGHYEDAGFVFEENIDLVAGHDLLVFRRPSESP